MPMPTWKISLYGAENKESYQKCLSAWICTSICPNHEFGQKAVRFQIPVSKAVSKQNFNATFGSIHETFLLCIKAQKPEPEESKRQKCIPCIVLNENTQSI